jgi:hypothetical protein
LIIIEFREITEEGENDTIEGVNSVSRLGTTANLAEASKQNQKMLFRSGGDGGLCLEP